MTGDEQNLAHEIGLTLRRLRRASGLTQKELAQRVAGGLDATYISRIERGDQLPSLKVLMRLSHPLGVTVSDFFYTPAPKMPDRVSASLHLEPLLQALSNRGIEGVSLVRAILDAVGQHVLAPPPRRPVTAEPITSPRTDNRTAIPLPMPEPSRRKD